MIIGKRWAWCAAAFGLAAALAAGTVPAKPEVLRFGASAKQPQALATAEAGRTTALARATPGGADFVSSAAWCWTATSVLEDGRTYTRLDLPGLAALGEAGEPRLPFQGQLIRVPAGADVRLVIDDIVWVDVEGRYVPDPVQPPVPVTAGAAKPPFARQAAAYARDAWTPEAPVRLADRMRIRGRDFVNVVYTPVACKPASAALRAATRVAWHLEYTLPAGGAPAPRRDPLGEAAFAPLFDLALDGTAPEESAAPASAAAPRTDPGADYLIITPDEYAVDVLPLAQLKNQMGLTVRLVTLMDISTNSLLPTAREISAYVRRAYETWDPPPAYLLLVGDENLLPAHRDAEWPGRTGMPPTDLYYATVDGDDIFPDMFYGRISCASAVECRTIAEKIVNHQVSPNTDEDFRNGVFIPAMFQDLWHSEEKGFFDDDGIEVMRFMESAEALKNYLEAKGVTVHTAYTADSDVLPRRYDRNSYYHEDSHTYYGVQEYLSNSVAAARTRLRMQEGYSLVSYHAHGGETGWDRFSVNDVPDMDNGTRLPFVISLTCLTGAYDFREPCLAEALLRKGGGGAAAVIASSRVAYQDGIDWTRMGLQESLWPDYFEVVTGLPGYTKPQSYSGNSVGRSARLGHALNFAKMFFYEKMGSQDGARYHYEAINLFGDPHMHFQPWRDARMDITHPSSASARLAAFDVVVRNGTSAVPGLTVTVTSTAGDNQSYTTDLTGTAHVSFAPEAIDHLTVTVLRNGYIPYFGTVDLVTEPMRVTHPATASAVAAGFLVNVRDDANVPLAGTSILVTSTAGDHVERTTDASGNAVFAMAPLSLTALKVKATKRAYTTYTGQIDLLPGTLRVTHAARVDELSGPVNVEVRDAGGASVDATVRLTGAGGLDVSQEPGPDCVARFAVHPLIGAPLQVRVGARGYTTYDGEIEVVAGRFAWDPLPATADRGGPLPVRVRLLSDIDGSSVITGYTGSAAIEAMDASRPPPPAVIVDVRRAAIGSYVSVEGVIPSGALHLNGWQLVANDDWTDINAVSDDIKDPNTLVTALKETYVAGPNYDVGGVCHWQAPFIWASSRPGWVMLLDPQTNVVDLVMWGWDAEEIATFAPVVRGRAVNVAGQWSGDGVPADPDNPHISRLRSAVPQDWNVAEDFETRPLGSAPPIFTNPFVGSGTPLEVTPAATGTFSNGVWQGTVSLCDLASNVFLRVSDGPRAADSELFDVVQAPHVQYGFDGFGSAKLWNVPFAVTVRAEDHNGTTYPQFTGEARLYGYVDAPAEQVLLTEVGVSAGSANFVEIQNVSKTAANTRDWKLVVGDNPANASGFEPEVVPLPDSMPSGALLAGVEGRRPAPGTLAFPDRVNWAAGQPGWAMLLDGTYAVVDFVAWGWPEADLTNMVVRIDGREIRLDAAWVGAGVRYSLGRYGGTLQRRGGVDYNRASDFGWGLVSSRGAANAGLDVPLLDARRPVALVPAGIGPFVAGVWTGDVTVREAVSNMYFEVRDALGLTGESPRFDVRYLGPITVTVPRFVREGDGTLAGQGTVSIAQSSLFNVPIDLRSTDTTEITVPATVTILGRQTSATFSLTVVDDTIADFTQDVRIRATGAGYGPGEGRVGVQDNEAPTVTLTVPSSAVEGAGTLARSGEIVLSAAADQDTTFHLASSDTTEIRVPATAIVRAGGVRTQFDIDVQDDALADGEQTAHITVTPDDLLVKTGSVAVADNEAFRFAFRELQPEQTACVAFAVDIEAQDEGGRRVTAYSGTPALTVTDGRDAYEMRPAGAAFVNGAWSGEIEVREPCRRVNLAADDGIGRGDSEVFDVVHGPLSRFVWTQSPMGRVHAGAWLPVRIEAQDAHGFPVTAFRGPARLEMTQHDPAHPVRLLTFVRYAQMDRGYRLARAALDREFPLFQEKLLTDTDVSELEAQLAEHDVFLIVAQEDAPAGSLAALGGAWGRTLDGFTAAGGVVIACSRRGSEHMLLREAGLAELWSEGVGSSLSPFVMLDTVVSNSLTAGVAARFEGQDVSGYSGPGCVPLVRSATNGVAVAMHRTLGAGHTVMIGNGFAEPSANFDRILANAVRLGLHRVPCGVPFRPEQTGAFVDGAWSGIVQVSGAGFDTQIDADDQEGHRGTYGLFDVVPLRVSGLRYDATERALVFEWPSAGVTPYVLMHASGSPDREYLPVAEGLGATPPLNVHTGKLGAATAGFYRLMVPPLD